jgi:peptidyl-prolyl cis-trans isomerase A (cyclophilin A)
MTHSMRASLALLVIVSATATADMGPEGDVQVTVTKTAVQVTPELVVDDNGPPGDVLDAIAAQLVSDLTRKLEIDGFATGADAQQRSQHHAEAVRDGLVARGLLPEQLVVRGLGARASKGQSSNRIEFRVVGTIKLPDVRPPVAADLATYTKSLQGSGALTATLETSNGTLHCALFDAAAPMTVANFVGLATGQKAWRDPRDQKVVKKPLYDGTTFHRVIPGFMIQGGDPLGTGTGYPGYRFRDEVAAGLPWQPGTMAMANAGPNTNGSQFFITEGAPNHLGHGYTIFGQCTEVDIVKAIGAVPRDAHDKPSAPVKIERVTISR